MKDRFSCILIAYGSKFCCQIISKFCCKSAMEIVLYLNLFQNCGIFYIWRCNVINILQPKQDKLHISACSSCFGCRPSKPWFCWRLYHFSSIDGIEDFRGKRNPVNIAWDFYTVICFSAMPWQRSFRLQRKEAAEFIRYQNRSLCSYDLHSKRACCAIK